MSPINPTLQTGRWIFHLMPGFAWLGGGARRAKLDIGRLSDHLKRDMGILDGNDPSAKHR